MKKFKPFNWRFTFFTFFTDEEEKSEKGEKGDFQNNNYFLCLYTDTH